tara:strand:- start:158 stop:1825 length:1668 start_codon:yes stop_codon:yes gene_type:complete
MNNKWDTTLPSFEYPPKIKMVFENINNLQRKSFSDWIGKISKIFKNDLDWWVSSAASRHNDVSKLFHNICILESLKNLNKKNYPDEIVVDSAELKKLIRIYLKNNKIKLTIKDQKKSILRKIYFIFSPLIFSIFIFLFSKFFKEKNNKIDKNVNNILIDTFVTSENLDNDRYYNKLGEKRLDNKKNIFFVPTILHLSLFKLPLLIKKIRSNQNFILKEDFIYFSDIIYALNYIFRKKKFYINYPCYKKWNLSKLIHEELSGYANFQAILISILNYRFAKNLKNKNIKLKKVIDWFENTTVDKGWNFGFRKFYPNTPVIGYQGFTLYRQFMCKHPSKAEYVYKVIPNKIIVVGKAYKEIRKEFCKNLKVIVGPALRFSHIFSYKYNLKKKYNILVTLNMDLISSNRILANVIKTEWAQSGKKVFIKAHPLMPLSKILPRYKIPDNFIELKGEFFKLAQNSEIVISAGISSSIIESVVYGCAVLMPYVDKNDYYNFRYLKIPKQSYKMCESTEMLDKTINYFLNEKKTKRNQRIKKINMLKYNLFEKTTSKNLNVFS